MARQAKDDSCVGNYFQRARQHYHYLKFEDDVSFLKYLGCSKFIKKQWYATGIKGIYYLILDLLDEIKQLKEGRERLEKQLQELLNNNKNQNDKKN